MKFHLIPTCVLGIVLTLCGFIQPANADEFANFQVNANCAWGQGGGWPPGGHECTPGVPGQTMTGTFTIDRTTGAVTAWEITSQFALTTYSSTGANYPYDLDFNRQDVSFVLPSSPSSGDFTIDLRRTYFWYSNEIPEMHCCTYPGYFDLLLPFAGSPETFSGGPMITLYNDPPNEFGIDVNQNEVLAGYAGNATLVSTSVPEPSSSILIATGLFGLLALSLKKLVP